MPGPGPPAKGVGGDYLSSSLRSRAVQRYRVLAGVVIAAAVCGLWPRPAVSQAPGGGHHQGQGLILELDNEFIKKYENRATITSDFTIAAISAVHPPKND